MIKYNSFPRIAMYPLLVACSILISAPTLAASRCATPEHPDICAKLIQFLNQGRAAGLLTANEWDPKTEHFHLYDKDKWRIKVTNSPVSTSDKQQAYVYNILLQQTGSGTELQRIQRSIERSVNEGRIIELNYNNQYGGAAGQITGPSIVFDQTINRNRQPTEDLLLGQRPSAVNVDIQPDMVSIQRASKNHPNKQIDKHNINQHFITSRAGSHLDHNERAFMVDSNDKAWSCKISGMGARALRDQNGNIIRQGHAETLHFQSRAIAHIPGNHVAGNGCLISVHK